MVSRKSTSSTSSRWPDEEKYSTPALTEAGVGDLLPATGKEFAAVYKFNINWVRSALAALEIAVDDQSDLGECKAALAKCYIKLNAAKSDLNTATSEVGAVGGSATKSTAKNDAHVRALRDRGVLLKKAPSPQMVAGLHWKSLGAHVGPRKCNYVLIAKK